MKKTLSFFILLFVLAAVVKAEVRLAPIFTSDMVLQQSSNVKIWGVADPNEKVVVTTSWSKKNYCVVAGADKKWSVSVPTPEASYNAHNVTIKGKNSIVLSNVLIGEVWLCSGQSNMEQPVKGYNGQPTEGSLEDILNSKNNYIRCYTVKKKPATEPNPFAEGSWKIASPETTGDFTATGYYFARKINSLVNVPVGIIQVCWGGSVIEAWTSKEALEGKPLSKPMPTAETNINKSPQHIPTALYNGMLYSVIGYGMKGAIWYQGESNRLAYTGYAELFDTMHDEWIAKWGIGAFPIYFCQIAPYNYKEDKADKHYAALMRETQQKIALTRPNTGIAILMDAGEYACIHPSKKRIAGERLAYWALAKNYGFSAIQYQSPTYKGIEIKNDTITVLFDNAPNGVASFQQDLTPFFEVAGKDKVFYPATSAAALRTKEGKVIVKSDSIQKPVAVRYAFRDYQVGSGALKGNNGLPVSSFRSDDWDDVK